MTSQFLVAVIAFLVVPTLVGKLFRLEKIFPLVFLQLLVGLCVSLSGLATWLKTRGLDLVAGPVADALQGMGALGVALVIALAGARTAPRESTGNAWRFVPISVIGFFSTCLLGSVLGLSLISFYPELGGSRGGVAAFSLAIGFSLSVTALPVLIAILRDMNLYGTFLGDLAVNCALLDDVWLWVTMAIVLSLTAAGAAPLQLVLSLAAYLAVMFLMIGPLLRRWIAYQPKAGKSDRFLLSISVILLSAICTNLIGLHSIFGAFVAGVILPRQLLEDWRDSLMYFCQTLLLPFFFVLTGMRLQIDISDPSFWTLAGLFTSCAVLVKFLSIALAARLTGLHWPQCFTLGSLMQCKGLMELVAINILLDAGVIGVQTFSALAMMALISTFITAPALQLLLHGRRGLVFERELV